ncbi:helix-turn-helix domain-containing protein [Aquimarina longa]|uniref:helix-turn-helix domain-containing protein n=1 Tax=Aquimarina longa TaxID=1080221 RepID=UPI0007834D81|nr:AraC family transcriptional regulator [Aquimarina longa]
MAIENIPEIYLKNTIDHTDLFIYDFRMTEDVIKTKVNLNMHMFSFLQEGKKQVHFSDVAVAVNKEQSLLLKKGNCLWTELLDKEAIYFCKLLFFSDKKLKEFLKKHTTEIIIKDKVPYFTIENDTFITSYLNSLTTINLASSVFMESMLSVKFEELMLYLINKYGASFESYLYSLISNKTSDFQKIIEKNSYTNLTLEEIAFLCNMSLSTFKRYFIKEYNVSPGKWLRHKRLLKAKELLEEGNLKSSDIYLDLGYNNLSNFSSAFKQKFGINPKDV